MKKAIGLLWATLLLACIATAQDRGIYSLPQSAREALIEMKATVRHGRLGGDYIAELTPAEVQRLRRQGIEPVLLFASAAEEEAARRQLDEMDEFHTYDQMRANFYSYAAAHPNIAQVIVLGYSIENRELFAMKISDNVAVEEDEPELAFWGNIHGNEYGGGEMPYLYALYLLDNYSTNPAVAARVDNNEIWCIPLINPDGRVHGTRDNMNGVDLNRDFGYQWDGWGGSDAPFGEVETQAVREFCLANNISLSTTFHCSGDVVFYQWGYSPNPAPDYNIIFRVGQRYAQAASYTFGNSWQDYETHGETLDFLYGSLGGLCYTVEVSNSSSSVNQTFARNQAGMNLFCDLAGQGIRGTVTDASTGQPVQAAVWISGSAIPAYTDPEHGDLHRLVLPGIYNLQIWANGYVAQSVSRVNVVFGAPGEFDVELQPGGGEYAFMVTSVNQEDPNNAHTNSTQPAYALGAPDGIPCSLGSNGFIVLDLGEGHEIVNGAGNDFTITEAIFSQDPIPETYRVYAGSAYVQNALLGTATGTASFDLAAGGVNSTRYLKIVDASSSSPNLRFAGMDLDAVTVLNSATTSSYQPPIAQVQAMPEGFIMSVAPNPFNPATVVRYQLPVAGLVHLEIFDLAGRNVRAAATAWQETGAHEMTFNGSDLPSGIYICRIEAGNFVASDKLVLLK